jgi:hypothetical protein
VIIEVLKFYGFKGEADMTKTETAWRQMAEGPNQHGWMKIVKYKLAAFFSSKTDQILPTPPLDVPHTDKPHMLIGGRAGNFLTLYLKRHDEMGRMSLLFSILQSKKGMPRADKSALSKAAYKTAQTLGTAPPVQESKFLVKWSERHEIPAWIPTTVNGFDIREQLKRTAREMFMNKPLTNDERMKTFFPSTSANYINNRARAGAVGYIFEHPTLIEKLRRPGGYYNIIHPKSPGVIIDEITTLHKYPEFQGNATALEFAFSSLWLNLLEEAKNEKPIAVPVALPEALKIRVITKMPPAQQTVLRCIWKKMHGILKKHPMFKFIGVPIDEDKINKILGHLEKDEVFLSGDYEAATDNLFSWVSETLAEECALHLKLHPVEKMLFIRSLTQHFIEVENPETKEEESIKQLNGQLMGSITSFCILCLANAAGTRWAHELAMKRKFSLRKTPGTVNGDDVALRTKYSGYRYWQQITAAMGLKESLGKTFVSDKFVQLNSMNYLYDANRTITTTNEQLEVVNLPMRYREVKYINFGLVSGQKRSGISGLNDQDDPRNTIGARYREMLRLAPKEMHDDAHKQFIEYSKDLLKKFNIPWFMPEWIGGLGLIGVAEPTELDRRIAVRILQNWKKVRPIPLGQSEVAWNTWKLAEKQLPEANFTENKEDPGIEERKKQMGYACVDLLFNSNFNLNDVFKGPEIEAKREKDATNLCKKRHIGKFEKYEEPCKACHEEIGRRKTVRALLHNQELWIPSNFQGKKHKLPKPISLERLAFMRKYETTTVKSETELVMIVDDYFPNS